MGSIGAPEILVILLVALIVLGPNRLPEAARQMGRALAELRRMSSGFQAELRDALQEGADPAPRSTPSVDATDEAAADQKYMWEDLPTSAETPPQGPGDAP